MKKIVNISNAPKPLAPYSQAVMANDTLYISGQIGMDPQTGKIVEGGVAAQCKQVMENIGSILKEVDFDYSNII